MNSNDSRLLKLMGNNMYFPSHRNLTRGCKWEQQALWAYSFFFFSSTTDSFQILISFLFHYLAYLFPYFSPILTF